MTLGFPGFPLAQMCRSNRLQYNTLDRRDDGCRIVWWVFFFFFPDLLGTSLSPNGRGLNISLVVVYEMTFRRPSERYLTTYADQLPSSVGFIISHSSSFSSERPWNKGSVIDDPRLGSATGDFPALCPADFPDFLFILPSYLKSVRDRDRTPRPSCRTTVKLDLPPRDGAAPRACFFVVFFSHPTEITVRISGRRSARRPKSVSPLLSNFLVQPPPALLLIVCKLFAYPGGPDAWTKKCVFPYLIYPLFLPFFPVLNRTLDIAYRQYPSPILPRSRSGASF